MPAESPCFPEGEYEVPEGMLEGQTLIQYYDCLCKFDPQLAQTVDIDCRIFTELYWYHPDYLGNTKFVTDIVGNPYQHFWYNPFGESVVNQSVVSGGIYSTPYRFNAKELDEETGLYYYGARYYDPKPSVWLSVDQRARWYPNTSPYAYVLNNPVNLIDPTGMSATCLECPDNGEFEFEKNSIFDYDYNPETGEATLTSQTDGVN